MHIALDIHAVRHYREKTLVGWWDRVRERQGGAGGGAKEALSAGKGGEGRLPCVGVGGGAIVIVLSKTKCGGHKWAI